MTASKEKVEATARPWRTIGAIHIWKTGEHGGAVCIIAEPDCPTSRHFKPVEPDSKRWDEAMANADLIIRAVNNHDKFAETLKAIVDCYGCGESPEKFVEHVSGFIEDGKKLLDSLKAENVAQPR